MSSPVLPAATDWSRKLHHPTPASAGATTHSNGDKRPGPCCCGSLGSSPRHRWNSGPKGDCRGPGNWETGAKWETHNAAQCKWRKWDAWAKAKKVPLAKWAGGSQRASPPSEIASNANTILLPAGFGFFCVPATPHLAPTRCRDNNYALWKSRYFLDLGLFQVSGRTGLCKRSSRSCGTAPHHVKLSRLSLLLAPDWLALPRKGGRFIDGPRGHHCDRHSIMSRCRCLSAHSHQRS